MSVFPMIRLAVVGLALGTLAVATAAQAADAAQTAGDPVVASIYQLDGTVRRATSLQLTADARAAATAQEALA